jgi:hypothetical protein
MDSTGLGIAWAETGPYVAGNNDKAKTKAIKFSREIFITGFLDD